MDGNEWQAFCCESGFLREEEGCEQGGGAMTVHSVVRWEGATHSSEERNERAAKMRR